MEEEKIQEFMNALAAEIGYHEVGYNRTKYAEFIDTNYPNFYNGKKNGYPWCCVFPHAIGIQTFGYENALELFCVPEHNTAAGCSGVAGYYNQAGRRIKGRENLRVGDQVVYGSCSYDHTGIIYQVLDPIKGIYLVIEGNYQDSVCLVKRNYSEMIFVGRPRWECL